MSPNRKQQDLLLICPKDEPITNLFYKQVLLSSDNTALVFEDKYITYNELDKLSNQFANFLINTKGINPNDLVGIMLHRSEWIIITILGVLKSRAAYVPIDPNYPLERKQYIKNDSECKIVIDDAFIKHFQLEIDKYCYDKPKIDKAISSDAMYVIYTSGTTGNPKGVVIEHKSVVNLIASQTQCFNIDETERILQFSNYCFDASIEQIFLALLNGASLFVTDNKTLKHHKLLELIEKHNITHLHATPSYLETLPDLSKIKSLKRIIAGGEACGLKLAQRLGQSCDFYNEYGPTETTVTSTIYKYDADVSNTSLLSIGKPIANTQVYIVSETMEQLSTGEIGELCLGGDGLARGYLNLPKLTKEKFIDNPFRSNEKMYCTGDYAKLNTDGTFTFIGRKDDQIKIRGYRIELGEIEATLSGLETVKRTLVIASDAFGADKRLVAYIEAFDDGYNEHAYRKQLQKLLPEYMLPSLYVQVEEFPINANGKVDKDKLPIPENTRPDSAPVLKKPRNSTEKIITKIWSKHLGGIEIGIDDNFFEMGGTSLLTQKVSAKIKTELNLDVPVTKIYQYPTISGLSHYLNLNAKTSHKKAKNQKAKVYKGEIAVIGMACRFPGASSIQELWNILKNGEETTTFFKPEELDNTIPEELRKDPMYVGARGIVASAKYFDARFFGINPKLAQAMDPQQRLFLEIAWEVLEQSGHLPKHYDGTVGVYAGTGNNTYYINNVLPNNELLNAIGRFQANTVNDKDYIASRIAYHLNLKGPAVSVHSACSTSLLAIAEAVEAIRNGQCDVALAGGSSVTSPINSGHLYQEGSMLSADGHCRSFDADGKGTVFSDGAGVVLLKRLEDAITDGDVIHGVIKGIGVNNDGGDKGSFTAPSVEGEAGAIINAMEDADIKPSDISYIEAHGTATPLGDPIEIEGLRLVFGKQQKNKYCAIGSIKSNMGHLTAAAGVAGVIKTILALKHQKIPASLGYERANPAIDFENSPFYVNNKLKEWNCIGKRRAGISSFGVGGTNVHIVVEEFERKLTSSGQSRPLQILTWSAKTDNSLKNYKSALGNYLKTSANTNLADVAYSLSATRDTFSKRSFTIANSKENAISQLLSDDANSVIASELRVAPNNLAFLFPGQGAQYLQMGRALYENENVFREAVDVCAKILVDAYQFDIRKIIYPNTNSPEAELILKETQFTQPALFVVEYALAQLWMSWGIKPTLLCGHSIGEFVAGHLAGIMSLKDALILVAVRGKLVSQLPGGSMLSVRMNYEELIKILPKSLSIATINSDLLCVVSGEDEAIKDFAEIIKEKEIPNRLLATSHAFHSTMMDPVLEDFMKEVKKVQLNTPCIPIISTVTGTWLSDREATDTNYWTDHLRATVRFSDAMETALNLDDLVLLEVGPGRALTSLSQQKKKSKSATSIASLVIPNDNENSYHTVLYALGKLWQKGFEPNWHDFYKNESRQSVWLPAYAFDHKLFWADPPTQKSVEYMNQPDEPNNNHPISSIQPTMNEVSQIDRKSIILEKISEIVLNTAGVELESSEYDYSFLELGLDSLVLTQMSITCKNEFNTQISFRQLNSEFSSPNLLANYLDNNLPPERYKPAQISTENTQLSPVQNNTYQGTIAATSNSGSYTNNDAAFDIIAQQLQLLGKQLELLKGNNHQSTVIPATNVVQKPQVKEKKSVDSSELKTLSEDEIKEHKKPFGASPKIEKQTTETSKQQDEFLKTLTKSYNKLTARSKAYTQRHRAHMSDPRVVSGFKPSTKELVYPIVIEKSSGNKLWDLDGNEYIDTLNGFGSCLFGHQPDFIKEALHQQVELGFEVGPQHPLAGEVCQLLCEATGHERAALCNTGSEAVLGAMRIARTVTGRSLIVAFSRSYHGINDEVIVRGSKMKKTFPAAPGILPEAVQNMLILDYGTEESLKIIKERANEIAAVLVEPIQSRRPEFQPVEFLREVREITKASHTTLIFDEIITGFRMHPKGIQGMYGIKADVATYGKVIGGGISIGAILGSSKYMDALDGGTWEFGDDSIPEVGVTYFAGTFVRHPLALATTKASLLHLRENSPKLQDDLADMTERLASELNSYFKNHHLPMKINYFRSLWRLSFLEEVPYGELIFVLMRSKGVHIWDGFPCYMTEAFKSEDISKVINCFIESIEELIGVGVLNSKIKKEQISSFKSSDELNKPPISGAKLGLDQLGNPAWFVMDKEHKNLYNKIELE